MQRRQPNKRPRLDGLGGSQSQDQPPRRRLNDSFSAASPKKKLSSGRQFRAGANRSRHHHQAPDETTKKIRRSMQQIDSDDKQRNQEWHKQQKRKFSLRKFTRLSIKVGFVSVLLIGGFLVFKLFSAAQSVVVDRGDSALGLQGELDPSQIKTEGDSRVNFLIIGVGGEGHEGGTLSDVNMVVSIDPVNKTASMLSVPRDFYLSVPDHYATKINAAHALGEQQETGQGPKTLERTMEYLLDIEIHYYVKADFQGFVDIIDAIGGVTVNVDETLIDNTIESGYNEGYGRRFYLEAGEQYLDGPTALQYVRCRKGLNCGNDFGRAERQQKLMRAAKDKVLSLGTFSNPLKVASILDTLGRHVRTNVDIYQDLGSILKLAEQIGSDNIESFVLSNAPDGYLSSYPAAGSALVPSAGFGNFTEIQSFVKGELFRDGFLARENARVTVLNGTTNPGLASEVSERLTGLGYNVHQVDNAPSQDVVQTKIYESNNNSTPFTRRLLEQRFNLSIGSETLPATLVQYSSDYIIIVGQDYTDAQ